MTTNKPVAPAAGSKRVLLKVNELGNDGTLVIGRSGTGKSTLIVKKLIAAKHTKVLWLTLNNTGAFTNLTPDEKKAVAEWDVAMVSDWNTFERDYVKAAEKGDLGEYQALVIDGGNKLAQFLSAHINPEGAMTQPQWYQMGKDLVAALISLRDKITELYFIVDVVVKADGKPEIDLNTYARNQVTPLFANKWYTTVRRNRDANNPKGTLVYGVQTNPALAIELVEA